MKVTLISLFLLVALCCLPTSAAINSSPATAHQSPETIGVVEAPPNFWNSTSSVRRPANHRHYRKTLTFECCIDHCLQNATDVEFVRIDIPKSCIVEVAGGYKLDVLRLLETPGAHPGGVWHLFQYCDRFIDEWFFYTHPMLPFERFKNYFHESTELHDNKVFDKYRKAVSDLGEKYWSWPTNPNCRNLARLVPELSKSIDPSKGRYPEERVRQAKKEWIEGIRSEQFPCSFAKSIAMSVAKSHVGFGLYTKDLNGVAAFLQDIYTYLDNLGSIYKEQGYLTAFIMQVPDAIDDPVSDIRKGDFARMDAKFAKFVKWFIQTARSMDSRLAGPAFKRDGKGEDNNFDFGGMPFVVQGGHPNSERLTRQQRPHPTLAFIPTPTFSVRDALMGGPITNFGVKDATTLTYAIQDAQEFYDRHPNPITKGIPSSCGISGRQKDDRKYCPIKQHFGKLPLQTCVKDAEELKAREGGWLQRLAVVAQKFNPLQFTNMKMASSKVEQRAKQQQKKPKAL